MFQPELCPEELCAAVQNGNETRLFSLCELQPLEAFHIGGLTCVPRLTLALPQEQAPGTRKVSHFLETRTHNLTWEKQRCGISLFSACLSL